MVTLKIFGSDPTPLYIFFYIYIGGSKPLWWMMTAFAELSLDMVCTHGTDTVSGGLACSGALSLFDPPAPYKPLNTLGYMPPGVMSRFPAGRAEMGLAMPGMPGSVGLVGPRAHRPTGPSLSLTLTHHHFGMNSARTRIHDFPIRKFCAGVLVRAACGCGRDGRGGARVRTVGGCERAGSLPGPCSNMGR